MLKEILPVILIILFTVSACKRPDNDSKIIKSKKEIPFTWDNASIYFLLTDRFYNGNPSNDINFDRTKQTAVLRGFKGGDIKGITQKIQEGYFNNLGVNAIWFTPVVEQIHGIVDEGTGKTYGYHGYWAKDWTSLDPNFGTETDLAELVTIAHQHGIRIILDVVINHTGPVTERDPVWPQEWVRTKPKCEFNSYETTVKCALVKNLPDIKTESNKNVELPQFLKTKWKEERRLEQELRELDEFFERTGYPKAPRFYIIKWLTDMIRKYGVDGFRIDTAKHTEESVWSELLKEATKAFCEWKNQNPDKKLDDNEFFMTGEVYGYNISSKRLYDYGDKQVDFYNHGLHSLINFGFKNDANKRYEDLFSMYSSILSNELKGKSVLNFISSHDDSYPFDKERKKPLESATKLLLCPGAAQIYYGDETMRPLVIPATQGDATLRSFMNWDELDQNSIRNGHHLKDVLVHWQKLGKFRYEHPAIGAGVHTMISENPYIFKRLYKNNGYIDKVVVGLDLNKGEKVIHVEDIFTDGTKIKEYYSNQMLEVKNGTLTIHSNYDIVLCGAL